ncbi:hypothetical protein D3C78_966830 [compost metagenome]
MHAVNTQHGLQRIGATTIAGLGIDRLNHGQHSWSGKQRLHTGKERFFSSLTAFAIELAVREGELVTHIEPRP